MDAPHLHERVGAATVGAVMARHKSIAAGLAVALVALVEPAASQQPIDHGAEYDACMLLAQRAPEEALSSARSWEEAAGGNAARHCVAIALFHLRRYIQAAVLLEELAAEDAGLDRALTAGLLDQAARAWLLAGEPEPALAALATAIALSPDDAELHLAIAYARAARSDYAAALRDLERAEALAPDHPEIPLLKAAALRFLGATASALAEANRAVAAAPGNPDTYLERGNILWMMEDFDGARRDWEQVLSLAPDSAAAGSARSNIIRLRP